MEYMQSTLDLGDDVEDKKFISIYTVIFQPLAFNFQKKYYTEISE